jgi:hypothetical protein
MYVYGIIITKEEFKKIILADIQPLFKNKIIDFEYKGDIFVGFSSNKMLINPQTEFYELSFIVYKFLKKTCMFYDLK